MASHCPCISSFPRSLSRKLDLPYYQGCREVPTSRKTTDNHARRIHRTFSVCNFTSGIVLLHGEH